MPVEMTDTQRAIVNEIAKLYPNEQGRELLKWALVRLSYYAPNEPCTHTIQQFLSLNHVKAISE